MAQQTRFIILNSDERFGTELRAMLRPFEAVKIVAEVEEPALLAQAVRRFPVDIVLASLDPNPEAILRIVGEVASAHPDLAIFAASESTDGQLILKAMRLGVREFLPRPIDASALGDAIEKIASQREDSLELGKLITVTGTSGGVGATMIATNLAVELAVLAEGSVTVVDLDYRFGQVATFLDVEPTHTLADLCASPEQLEQQVIQRALIPHESGVYVLSRPASLAQADTMTASSCVGVLATLLQFNKYVVTDGPSRFDVSAKAVLDMADASLLVTQLLVPTVRNAARIIESMRDDGYNLDHARLVCNRAGNETGQLSVDDVAETLGLTAFAAIPEEWSVVSGAINLGESLAVHGPKSRVRAAIQKIAERLHDNGEEAGEESAPKKSLIGRIFATS